MIDFTSWKRQHCSGVGDLCGCFWVYLWIKINCSEEHACQCICMCMFLCAWLHLRIRDVCVFHHLSSVLFLYFLKWTWLDRTEEGKKCHSRSTKTEHYNLHEGSSLAGLWHHILLLFFETFQQLLAHKLYKANMLYLQIYIVRGSLCQWRGPRPCVICTLRFKQVVLPPWVKVSWFFSFYVMIIKGNTKNIEIQ